MIVSTRACSRKLSTIKRSTRDGFGGNLGIGTLLALLTFFPG